jgi:3'-phosphoadenosine 5'-phosphosulfate sulfotransferase (PAPS reductase)/FAD synthetase
VASLISHEEEDTCHMRRRIHVCHYHIHTVWRSVWQLGVQAWFTGRRRSQGGARESLPLLEIDASDGRLKMNPLINWEFDQVPIFFKEN